MLLKNKRYLWHRLKLIINNFVGGRMKIFAVITLQVLIISCSSVGRMLISPETEGEPIAKSHKEAPAWVTQGNNFEGKVLKFVGVSPKCCDEQYARELAVRNGIDQCAMHVSTEATSKYKESRTRDSVGSTIATPEVIELVVKEQMSKVRAKPMAKDFYIEKYMSQKGNDQYYLAYALVEFNKNELEEITNKSVKELNSESSVDKFKKVQEKMDQK